MRQRRPPLQTTTQPREEGFSLFRVNRGDGLAVAGDFEKGIVESLSAIISVVTLRSVILSSCGSGGGMSPVKKRQARPSRGVVLFANDDRAIAMFVG